MCHAFLLSFILVCFIGFVFLFYNLRYSNCITRIQSEIPRFYNKNTIWVFCLFSFVLLKFSFLLESRTYIHWDLNLRPYSHLVFKGLIWVFQSMYLYLFPVATGINYFCSFYVFFAAVTLNDSKYVLACQQAWIVVTWLCSGLPSVSPCLTPWLRLFQSRDLHRLSIKEDMSFN